MRANGTRTIATTLLAVLLCVSTACTTMHPIVADASGEKVREALKPGDTVHVLTKSGASRSFEVIEIRETSLVGKTVRMFGVGSSDRWGSPIEMPYADIAQIEIRQVKSLPTLAIAAAVLLVVDAAVNSSKSGQRCCISR